MKCKERTRKFVGWAAKILGPVLGPQIPGFVTVAQKVADVLKRETPNLLFGGHEKRALVWEMVKDEARASGHDVYDDTKAATEAELERATRAAIESAVHSMKRGTEKLAELGDWSGFETDADVASAAATEMSE